MRILLWHGYLLRDSGSNIYTANVARHLRRLGHDVLLLCQERRLEGLDFIDDEGELRADSYPFEREPGEAARCRLARPWIGDLLPVYVFDEYEGFLAKTFTELDDFELERYTELNVEALTTALKAHRPEAVIVGHEVMGPFIASKARAATGRRYVVKLHGSALEYAVKRQRRYREFAHVGLGAAHRVVGGSKYMIRAAAELISGWESRGVVVNPGCDTDLFVPAERSRETRPTIGFVGKLIEAKGVHNLLRALPTLRMKQLSVVIVGGGSDASWFRRLWSELASESSEISVEFTGALGHAPLSRLLATFDVLVAPSVVPEAFGMVVAEAAACGVLPIVPDHSGIAEAGAQVEQAIGRPGWLTFDSREPVEGIASAIDRVLAEPLGVRAGLEKRAVDFARAEWSWEAVAGKLLDVAT
ncbi:MAG: glycosyltransferase family 4 protein [Actinomycetota bacterium]